jgi:NAD(P)-dependent dehydrogenase (short-subunit alcohol dehydrogenase family)
VNSPVLQTVDPRNWKDHLFGLTPSRWERFRDSAFWITGAGTGYGRALAVALSCAGSRVFLTGRRAWKLTESIEEAVQMGAERSSLIVLPADITSEEEVVSAARTIEQNGSRLCGVIHSAAVPQRRRFESPLMQEPIEFWRTILWTNVVGPWLVTRNAVPLMVRTGTVRVLFLSSEAGWANTVGFGQYNVSKAALNTLGASMAEECAQRYPDVDVQMNVVVPGEARTEMNQGSDISPYTLASMGLLLLSHPPGGPNGKFFHRDGRHLSFAYSTAYERSLVAGPNR